MALLAKIKNNDIAEEEEIKNNECILEGFLKEDDNVDVTVGGCSGSDTFEVNIPVSE